MGKSKEKIQAPEQKPVEQKSEKTCGSCVFIGNSGCGFDGKAVKPADEACKNHQARHN